MTLAGMNRFSIRQSYRTLLISICDGSSRAVTYPYAVLIIIVAIAADHIGL